MKLLAVIRIRGQPDRRPEERKTLELLRLRKRFHCVLVPDTPSIRGMLKVVEYVVTYGEIDKETLALLLERRGRLTGNRRLTPEYLKSIGFNSFEELAEALLEGKVRVKDLPEMKPVFRLHPPSGGFKGSVKKHYREGGELGYRGPAINELLKRMI
ncbi:MAG: 50S ribosomal protein L30 [Thermoprotei archaeon]|nr:MAG: 50S ribosomal protein L30 [Thermoprotei archaeon]